MVSMNVKMVRGMKMDIKATSPLVMVVKSMTSIEIFTSIRGFVNVDGTDAITIRFRLEAC